MANNRTYLTKAEAMSWGEFLHSDTRRMMKQRDAEAKLKAGIIGFTPWTQAMRQITKEDMKVWREMYERGVRDFNKIEEPPAPVKITIDVTQEPSHPVRRKLWEASFICNCGAKGRKNFEYIKTEVNGELWKCSLCQEKDTFPNEPTRTT